MRKISSKIVPYVRATLIIIAFVLIVIVAAQIPSHKPFVNVVIVDTGGVVHELNDVRCDTWESRGWGHITNSIVCVDSEGSKKFEGLYSSIEYK